MLYYIVYISLANKIVVDVVYRGIFAAAPVESEPVILATLLRSLDVDV